MHLARLPGAVVPQQPAVLVSCHRKDFLSIYFFQRGIPLVMPAVDVWPRVLLLSVCCWCGTLAGGGAPDPYPSIHGGTSGSPPPASPDPLAGYHWANISSLADRFHYQVYYDAPVAADSTDKAAFEGLETLLNNTGRAAVAVRSDGTIRLKFAAEGASWLEFDSSDLAEAIQKHGVTVQMSISENRLRAPSESGKLKQYNNTFRLELNKDLYEGVRYAFLTVAGMQQSTPPWHISALRRVSQAIPANYEGSFSSSDSYVLRLQLVVLVPVRLLYNVRGGGGVHYQSYLCVFGRAGLPRLNLNEPWRQNRFPRRRTCRTGNSSGSIWHFRVPVAGKLESVLQRCGKQH